MKLEKIYNIKNEKLVLSLENKHKVIHKSFYIDKNLKNLENFNDRFDNKKIESYIIENAKLIGNEFCITKHDGLFKDKGIYYLTSEETVKKKHAENVDKKNDNNLILCGANSGYKNFYHWVFQCLPTIILLKQIYQNQDYKIVVPPLNGFRKKSLELAGIDESEIIILQDDENLSCKEIAYTNLLSGDFSFNPNSFIYYLLEKVKNNALKSSTIKKHPKKIYISRKDSPRRNLTNDLAISTKLSKYGYEEIVMSDFSLEDQISIMANAEYIISPHGAALVHLCFINNNVCKSLIEIIPSNYNNNCFQRLCQSKKITYSNIVASSEHGTNYHHTSNRVNIEDLLAVLEKVEKIR